jgi:predicted pyridoxine 5'-phosphate oxidase superfamily flavin-nucleotide-binding protein
MKKISEDIIRFFLKQGYVIVSTIDKSGFPHSSCKGIVKIEPGGRVFLLDVYKAWTHENLRHNAHISVTAVDEHKFIGYCLKGKAEMMPVDKVDFDFLQAWEERITSRLTQRLLKNIRGEKGHHRQPEALLPRPEYLIVIDIDEIVDLTPHHIKEV